MATKTEIQNVFDAVRQTKQAIAKIFDVPAGCVHFNTDMCTFRISFDMFNGERFNRNLCSEDITAAANILNLSVTTHFHEATVTFTFVMPDDE